MSYRDYAAEGAFDRVDARKHGSGRVEERVSYPSTMNRRWEHPCNVRFGRDVVNILEAADAFLRRPPEHRDQPVG